jgi:ATP-dependent RNA helicase RhlE
MKFETLGFSDLILESLGYMGFKEATPIQEQAIPHIFEGRDILASAQTGTGKTAAFMLPILDMISRDVPDSTTALIIVPTRELALQIDQEIQAFSYTTNISSIPLYGGGDGQDWETQKRALESGVHVVVATPGKLKSFIQNKYLDCGSIKYLILDEADRMLDIGFYDDIISIIENLPKKRQNLLFSATMPDKIIKLSKQVLSDPVQIKIAISKPNENILQASFLVYDTQKVELLRHLIKDKPKYSSIIIFSSTKKNVSRIVSALRSEGMSAQAISSDLAQKDREAMLNDFKARKVRILVATDVISRGIDIKEISLVINFDVPRDAEDYVHRIGRTARAEASGVAITLINPDDMRYFHQIEQLIGKDVIKLNVPKELGESPAWDVSGRKKSDSFNSRKKSVRSRNFKKHKKKKD